MKQFIKRVTTVSRKRYPYNGKYHFDISRIDMDFYVVEHVRLDGRIAQWQPCTLRAHFSTLEAAEKAIEEWANRPLVWRKKHLSPSVLRKMKNA